MKELKKVKIKKEYGEWYYLKYQDGDLDFPIYEIYNAEMENVKRTLLLIGKDKLKE